MRYYNAIDRRNTVGVIRIPPQALTGPFVLTVETRALVANAVPGQITTTQTRISHYMSLTPYRHHRKATAYDISFGAA